MTEENISTLGTSERYSACLAVRLSAASGFKVPEAVDQIVSGPSQHPPLIVRSLLYICHLMSHPLLTFSSPGPFQGATLNGLKNISSRGFIVCNEDYVRYIFIYTRQCNVDSW